MRRLLNRDNALVPKQANCANNFKSQGQGSQRENPPAQTPQPRKQKGFTPWRSGYKVLSLGGPWLRALLSTMALATPTGFHRFGLEHQPVKGQDFCLSLSEEDKRALIAFLTTL